VGAAHEVEVFAQCHPDATILTGECATVEAVLDALNGATLVHLAAHGVREPINVAFSDVVLANGTLTGHEMTRLLSPPDHVVLATDNLSVGSNNRYDQPFGFSGMLLSAGTSTVIAAMPAVSDQVAAETFTHYHVEVLPGPLTPRSDADARTNRSASTTARSTSKMSRVRTYPFALTADHPAKSA
jgi:CHAT domain-containing protein